MMAWFTPMNMLDMAALQLGVLRVIMVAQHRSCECRASVLAVIR